MSNNNDNDAEKKKKTHNSMAININTISSFITKIHGVSPVEKLIFLRSSSASAKGPLSSLRPDRRRDHVADTLLPLITTGGSVG